MGGSMLAQVTGQFGAEVPDLDDPQLLEVARRRDHAAARRRPGARVPRPQRRRPLGGGVRDGVRRPPRRQPQRRPARHRRRRHRRQPRRVRRFEELGAAGERAARGADAARALQRGARRDRPGGDGAPRRGAADPARRRPRQAQPRRRQDQRARGRRGLARCQGRVQRAAARPAPGVGRGQLAHLPAARQPGVRRRRARRGRPRRRSRAARASRRAGVRRVARSGAGDRRQRARRSRCCASRASTATSS